MSYIIYSGEFTNNKNIINIHNRAFRYGDSFFESMFYSNKIISIDKHWKRIEYGISTLKMKLTQLQSAEEMEYLCKKLIKKNNIRGAARIRLQFFRKGEGLYLPQTNETEYIIEVSALKNKEYTLNSKGLQIGIATNIYKDLSYLSQIKTTSKQEMIIAAIQAKEQAWDEAILCNSKGKIAETTSSNIFILIDNKIITPPLSDGPLNGIMRQNIMEICSTINIEIIEKSITREDLMHAKEVFITNAIKGIQWIEKFENNLYKNKVSKKLVNILNNNYLQ